MTHEYLATLSATSIILKKLSILYNHTVAHKWQPWPKPASTTPTPQPHHTDTTTTQPHHTNTTSV